MGRAYLVAIVRNTSIRIQDMGNTLIFLWLPFHILRMTSGAKIGQKWEKMLRSGALWGNMRAVENDRAGFRNALQTKSNPPQNAARKGTRGRHCRHRRDKRAAPNMGVDLNGEFHFKVDGKGRMALPAKFRKVLSKDLVVTPELTNECVYVFETPDFNEWVEKLFIDRFGEYKESDREHVKLRRVLKSRARDVEVDASGRIMLSPEVRAAVGIDKEVVVVGNTGRFEIWDADRFKAMSDEVDLGCSTARRKASEP